MAQKGRDCEDAPEYKAIFVDTNLDTHLAIPVSSLDTIFDIKRKILTEHSKCFREFGLIKVHALKVKRKSKLYSLSDLMPITSVFTGASKGWFLSADISGQFCHNEVVDNNNPNTHMLIAYPSIASHLQRGHNKNGRIFQADEPSGEARSENLQLVVGFKNDDNLKSSSSDSDKRLNTLVEDTYRANCEKDINSSGLVTSVNPVEKSVNIGSLEKDKAKKKRKVVVHVHSSNGNDAVEIVSTDKDGADRNPELTMNLDLSAADSKQSYHAVTDVGSADQNKIKDKSSSEINRFKSSAAELRSGSGADIEQSVGPHSEGKKGIESHGKDMKDVSMGSDKTKDIAKNKNKRMTKLEAMNDDKFTDSDASANVSVKSLAAPSGFGTTEKGGVESVSLHVQCNNSTVIPTNMDEAVTEALGRVESVPDAKGREKEIATNGSFVESGMKRSKKRKNTRGDVSHQMDIKGKEELGVHEIGGMEKGTKMLAESEMTRPLKRSKTGNGTPDAIKMDRVEDDKSGMLSSKQHNQTPKPIKKVKQKQTPAIKKVSESGMKDQSDTIEPEKRKATLSKSAVGKEDNDETSSSSHKQMDRVLPVVTSEVDIEMSSKVGLDDVLIPSTEGNVKPQQEADDTIRSDAELQLTQVRESMDNMNKRSSKKMNLSQFPVKDKKNNMKRDSSNSAFPNLTVENSDDTKFLSSFQEQIDKAGSGADYNVDIEMKKAEIGVDEKVFVTNNGSEICSPKEADETIRHSAASKKLTSIQKRERDNRSKTEKSKKKMMQKPQLLKSISEFPVEDSNNSTKVEGNRSTVSRSDDEKAENEFLSSASEKIKIDNMSLISASQAEISTKVQPDIMTNFGRDVSLQQEEDNTCQNDIEPMQLSQVQKVLHETVKDSVQTKKKTKQQQTRVGKNLPEVVKDDSRSDTSLAPAQPLNAAPKNKADIMKSKVESSFLKTKDSSPLIHGYASTRVGNTNDSRASSSHSDMLNKRSHERKSMKELQKMKEPQSSLHRLSDKSTKKVVQKPSNKNRLISKCSSIFKDESSSSSEHKIGGDDSNSITEVPNDDHLSSSDYSEDESRGSWASPKQGNVNNGGSAKSMQKNLTMEAVLRSSHKYKKAKLVASQSQLEEDESQTVDFVPDSQVNK